MKAALAADALALEAATEKSTTNSGLNGSMSNSGSLLPREKEALNGDHGSVDGKKKNDKSKKKNGEDGNSETATRKKGEGDANVIPWNCPVMPRTPYDVSILLSNLSTTPDCSVAFGKDFLCIVLYSIWLYCEDCD